ncbi:MAG: hypothetical protein LJE69_14780 [Thiohalocapsa sp.]|jgi:predicted nucleic acid-binding Zn ribbon protein|uniref:hypothetical protein n=1 Tax=Thiohalocapsa sp. TaxID=2497641 RepID=UPI0025E5B42C|nr:hypothetical protein [Thiohalocapsa sp.]MCG6942501.1 hypothetical protein [Thiohalocapsa sp.]
MGYEHASTCAVCGTALTVHERACGSICADPECRRTHLRRRQQSLAGALRRTRTAVARWRRQFPGGGDAAAPGQVAAAQGAEPTALLPANTRRLVPLPARRRRRFRDYFTRSLSVALAPDAGHTGGALPGEESVGQATTPADAATVAMLGRACAVCRGHCCAQGGEHAFLRPEVVRAYLSRHPALRPREVLAAYLDRLPWVSYQDACVFHTRHGCNLPRGMRSRTCNDYRCGGLMDLARRQQADATMQVFAVAVDGETPVRAALIRRPTGLACER